MPLESAVGAIRCDVISYFYRKDRADFMLPEDTYSEWALLTCEEGRFHYRIAEQSGEVRVGEAVLCPPGVALHRRALTTLTFHFSVFRMRAYLHGSEEAVEFPYKGKLSFHNSSRLLSTLACMRESRYNVSLGYTGHLLSDILFQYIGERAARDKLILPGASAIWEAVHYINENAFGNVSMQIAAAKVGLSQSQFTRKFQKEMGLPPVKYLTRLRVRKTAQLLAETEDSLETIAEHCGYQNAFYMSRVFSAEMNMSPTLYRRTHRV